MVMLGAYLAKTQLFDDQLMIRLLEKLFGEKKAHLIGLNHQAITAGRDYYNQNYK